MILALGTAGAVAMTGHSVKATIIIEPPDDDHGPPRDKMGGGPPPHICDDVSNKRVNPPPCQ